MKAQIKKYLWLLVGFFLSGEVVAQPDPMFSMYFQNMQIFNPAYAGSWQAIGFTALNRIQWMGIKGNPNTQTFTLQAPLKYSNVGLGVDVILDRIGLERHFSFDVDYSYRIKLNERTSLRLGIKGGFTNYSNPLPLYSTYDPGDPAYFQEIRSRFMPNFGMGAFLTNERTYLGLSVPWLIETRFIPGENYTLVDYRQLYLSGGTVWGLTRSIKFKPAFITKIAEREPFQFDLSANFLFKEKFWLGAMVRSEDAVGVNAQWIFNEKLRIGYAYDFTTSDLQNYQNGVHEVMISYELNSFRRRYVSPRYF